MPLLSFGFVSDEISLDFRQALDHGLHWGVRTYELRSLRTGRVPGIDRAEFQDVLHQVSKNQVTISALSPGIFKHPLSRVTDLERELTDVLPRTIEMAEALGSRLIIVFGFQREADEPAEGVRKGIDLMRRAAELAGKHRMRIAIENEPGFWCDSGANTAGFIRKVGSPSLGANWDPCNGFGTSELPYPDGYSAVKEFIFNVHAKDTEEGALIRCVPIGEGVIDWKGQVGALISDHVVSHITIETHCHPLVENSRKNLETLLGYVEKLQREKKTG